MKFRISKDRFRQAGFALFSVTIVMSAMAFRNPTEPATAKHFEEAGPAPPGDVVETTAAENWISARYMLRGYCYAKSQMKDRQAPGGFAPSDNAAKRWPDSSKGRGLYLWAEPGVVTQFHGRPGMRVMLVNRTRGQLAFEGSDSRLAIIQEAQDGDGTWRPIEYLPSSWCGNSFHRVFLAPDHYWTFAAPRYKGSIPTKLRFAMNLTDGSKLCSNTFDGSVHPEQFSIKQGHRATDIMDPYID